MKRFIWCAVLGAVALGAWSCGSSSPTPATGASAGDKGTQGNPAEGASTPAAPATPAVPDEIQKAAETALGSETEVLLYGDLAKNGARQILAVNRMKMTPQVTMPGTVITRGVILENIGGTWKEILRCDEHLENPKGYLGNIPLAPVNGWRLQYEQDNDKGRREIEQQAFVVILLVLQAPPVHGRQRNIAEISLGIFQMLVAAQDFLPCAADAFQDHSARDHSARHGHLRRHFHAVHGQNLSRAVFGQVAVQQHVGLGAERRFRGLLYLVRHSRFGWRAGRCGSRRASLRCLVASVRAGSGSRRGASA